ncbi:MAG: hypothetical protein MJE68_20130 [Proteobacteria bacterium]|nr:hypothetical protein [Pseudomonadota bacterium]
MPNTPNNNGDKNRPPRPNLESAGEDALSREERRADERHAETLEVQERFVKVNERISLATLIYAIAAVAMLLWSVAMFVLGRIYF